MDSLTYKYNTDGNGNLVNNRLNQVRDQVSSAEYATDIDNQVANNYSYDAIGNLTADASENITSIDWNVYIKITRIQKTATANNPVTEIRYSYNAAGNRISKQVTKNDNSQQYTWYVRDAVGNVMATYESNGTVGSLPAALTQAEVHLYGSSRLGIWQRNQDAKATYSEPTTLNSYLGGKFFELSNHLGNVLVTVSDKKVGVDSNGDGLYDYFKAEVASANDYYLIGMLMPGRGYKNDSYRYGFNGKENDNEVKGTGNQVAYENRIYDPRIARWYSLDPLQKKYPNESNYGFVSGNPILYADKAGLDKIVTITTIGKDGKVTQIRSIDKNIFEYYHDYAYSGMGYFMKADVVQNYIVDLRKDGAEQLSYTYDITNRKEISALEYLRGKTTNGLQAMSGYGQDGKKEYGYRIVGSNYDALWDEGLPKAKESDALYLGDWLDMVGGFRESETPTDLWQATINLFRSKGVKIGNGAKQIEEAAQYLTNISSNLIEEVSIVEKIKERLSKEKSSGKTIFCTTCKSPYRDSANQWVPTTGKVADTSDSHTLLVDQTKTKHANEK